MPPATAQFTLVGFSQELDWRPLTFVKPIPPNKVCSACGLVRKRSAHLPCLHVLCESCYEQCAQDGLHVCPLDGYEWHDEDDVDWKDLPPDQLLRREVKCWNADSGCQHVIAASLITQHFQQECAHHSTCCPKCSTSILCKDVYTHLRSGSCCSVTNAAFEFQGPCDIKEESVFPNPLREAFEKQAEELKGYLERMSVDISIHGDRLCEISHSLNAFKEALRQELATGVRNPENLNETLCELAASNGEIKERLTTLSDTGSHLSTGMNRLEKVLKDQFCNETTGTAGKLLRITARLEEFRNQEEENGRKMLELTKLQRTWCEFFVTGVKSMQEKALKEKASWFYSKQVYLRGYFLIPALGLRMENGSVTLVICLQLLKGDMDEVLQWPMEHKIKLSVIHPEKSAVRHIQFKPPRSSGGLQKPTNSSNHAVCFPDVSLDLSDLLRNGFIEDDKLRVRWQLLL